MTTTLTRPEAYTAAMIGVLRNLSCVFAQKQGAAPDDMLWQIHIEGALGEMAAAKALQTYNPLTVNTFKDGGDIGECVQVRTRSRDYYDLIVRENDPTDHVYVLVTGRCPEYIVHGWCWGHEARKPQYVANHGGHGDAWFVPQHALKPLDEIPKEVL